MLFGEKKEMDGASLKELRGLVEEFGVIKERRSEISAEDKGLIEQEKELGAKIQAILKDAQLDDFSVPDVGKVYKIEKFYANLPKTNEDWDALFGFLKAEDREDLITVNSQSLTSFYQERMTNALKEGNPDFKMPGINGTGIRVSLGFRRES